VFYYELSQIPKHNNALIFAMKYALRWLLYHIKNPSAKKRLLEIIREDKVDVIHTNSMVVDLGVSVSRKSGVRHVMHLRELLKENYNCYPMRKNYIEQISTDNCQFIAVSEFVKEKWVALGVESEKISVIYDGVDASAFRRTKANEQSDKNKSSKLKLVMCGSFCKAKGQKLLLQAIALLSVEERKNVSVALYGNKQGTYYEETLDMIHSLGIDDCIEVMGYFENIAEELQKYDCGVMCSENEAFGRVTVEYMLAGLCPIIPDAGANREITNNGEYALFYRNNDAGELADTLRRLMNNRQLILEYGGKGKEYALRHFDINANSERIIEKFNE